MFVLVNCRCMALHQLVDRIKLWFTLYLFGCKSFAHHISLYYTITGLWAWLGFSNIFIDGLGCGWHDTGEATAIPFLPCCLVDGGLIAVATGCCTRRILGMAESEDLSDGIDLYFRMKTWNHGTIRRLEPRTSLSESARAAYWALSYGATEILIKNNLGNCWGCIIWNLIMDIHSNIFRAMVQIKTCRSDLLGVFLILLWPRTCVLIVAFVWAPYFKFEK